MKLLYLFFAAVFVTGAFHQLCIVGNLYRRRPRNARLVAAVLCGLFLLGAADAFCQAVMP